MSAVSLVLFQLLMLKILSVFAIAFSNACVIFNWCKVASFLTG